MYGAETEIFVHTFQKTAKTQNLIAEREGRNTIDNPLRFKLDQNHWTIISASSANRAASNTTVFMVATDDQAENKIKDILDTLSRNLRGKGTYGLAHLKNAFKEIDVNGNGTINQTELRNGFRKNGFILTDEEVDIILQNFDTNKNGVLEFEEFVGALNVILRLPRLLLTLPEYR